MGNTKFGRCIIVWEIMGVRQRYRVVDLERLCWRLGSESLEEVRKNLEVSLAQRIAREQMKREACWTESLAVGSAGFVERFFKPTDFSRRETEVAEAGDGAWALQETELPYGQETGPKNAANALRSTVSGAIHLQSNELLW